MARGILLLFVFIGWVVRAATNQTFPVIRFAVEGNSLLKPEEVQEALKSGLGEAVELTTLRQAAAELQATYRRHGYVTVAVTLPAQKLTNGVVRIEVREGRLSRISVVGNRWHSEGNVRRALPTLTTNRMLNLAWFDPELDRANENRDRQIYPSIEPGKEPGTSAMVLKVKDQLPLHGHVEMNNRATPNTPMLRLDTALQYNNVWDRDHQLGFQSSLSPQKLMVDDRLLSSPVDAPAVASYSGFYRMPLAGLTDKSGVVGDAEPHFGYDPVRRTFVLPSSTGAPELLLYASRASSETSPRFGPQTTVTNSVLLDLFNQSIDRNISLNQTFGGRFTIPLAPFLGVSSSVSFGMDYKSFQAWTEHTNLSTVNLYSTNGGDRVLTITRSITNSELQAVAMHYLPLTVGWTARKADGWGNSTFSISPSLFLDALGSDSDTVRQVAGSTQAGATYATVQSSLTREQRLYEGWSLLARSSGQWASSPLIGNEQFLAGGSSGVRGYEEGEDYGDAGWKVQMDLRAPAWKQETLEGPFGGLRTNFRFSGFLDYGERYLLDAIGGRPGSRRFLGTGIGWLINVGDGFEARLVLSIPLLDGPLTSSGTVHAYFNVGYQF